MTSVWCVFALGDKLEDPDILVEMFETEEQAEDYLKDRIRGEYDIQEWIVRSKK